MTLHSDIKPSSKNVLSFSFLTLSLLLEVLGDLSYLFKLRHIRSFSLTIIFNLPTNCFGLGAS